jgi:hypothetical protein
MLPTAQGIFDHCSQADDGEYPDPKLRVRELLDVSQLLTERHHTGTDEQNSPEKNSSICFHGKPPWNIYT